MEEQKEINSNLLAVAHRGRDPDLYLSRSGEQVPLRQWGSEILDVVGEMCDLLDTEGKPKLYCNSLSQQLAKLYDPQTTPSGNMLREMRENEEDFFDFGQRKSLEHRDWFDNNPVSESLQKQFIETAQESLVRQKQIEQGDNLSFDEFLQQYFSQLDRSNAQ